MRISNNEKVKHSNILMSLTVNANIDPTLFLAKSSLQIVLWGGIIIWREKIKLKGRSPTLINPDLSKSSLGLQRFLFGNHKYSDNDIA